MYNVHRRKNVKKTSIKNKGSGVMKKCYKNRSLIFCKKKKKMCIEIKI